jgi:hypothetical protein
VAFHRSVVVANTLPTAAHPETIKLVFIEDLFPIPQNYSITKSLFEKSQVRDVLVFK